LQIVALFLNTDELKTGLPGFKMAIARMIIIALKYITVKTFHTLKNGGYRWIRRCREKGNAGICGGLYLQDDILYPVECPLFHFVLSKPNHFLFGLMFLSNYIPVQIGPSCF